MFLIRKFFHKEIFCEQNVIVNKNKYFLIDFESLGIQNRALEIAFIFVTFGRPFSDTQQKIFLKEYCKLTKADYVKLKEKTDVWIPITQFMIFLWAVKHVLRIKSGYLHKDYSSNSKIKSHIVYAKKVFRHCLKIGVIDRKYKNFDLRALF